MSEHTKLRWKLIDVMGCVAIYGNDGNKHDGVLVWHEPTKIQKANAKFIVKACNNYDKLREALEEIIREDTDSSDKLGWFATKAQQALKGE